jgi:hypothetical protein
MIFLDLYTLPNSTSGIDQILVDTITVIPQLPYLILMFVWFVIFLGGMGQQKMRLGVAETSTWALVSSLAIFFLTLLMSIPSGIINLTDLGIVVAITILSAVWFFFDKRQGEI